MFRDLQVDLRVGAGEQRACRIVHVYFDQQGTGCHVDGIGGAHEVSAKGAGRKLSETKISCHTHHNPLRIFLRDVYVHAQYSRLSDVEEIGLNPAAAAGGNEVADICVPSGDDAVERSVNLFE